VVQKTAPIPAPQQYVVPPGTEPSLENPSSRFGFVVPSQNVASVPLVDRTETGHVPVYDPALFQPSGNPTVQPMHTPQGAEQNAVVSLDAEYSASSEETVGDIELTTLGPGLVIDEDNKRS
jgi:hypothetical protein